MDAARQCKPVSGSATTAASRSWDQFRSPNPVPARVQGHVRLLALFWLAFSAFNTVGAIVLYIVANTIFAHAREFGAPEAAGAFLRPLLSVIAILLLAKAALGFIAGWGLLQHESWARILALVLRIYLAVHEYPVRNRAGYLHHVGASILGFGARVRGTVAARAA